MASVPTRSLPQAHPWMPTSPCGPDCLDTDSPRIGRARALLRVATALGVLAAAILCGPALLLLGGAGRERGVRWVSGAVLRAFEVRLAVHGGADFARPYRERARRGTLVVNNHISWLDIVAVNAVRPMRAIAKSDIASWPVLGRLVAKAGTVFVDREGLSKLPSTVAELAEVLRNGSLINLSGEGTTWCGRDPGRFVPAPFQAAIDGGVPVRPLALRYRVVGGQTAQPAFIGTESLVASVWRVARLRGLVLEVFVCDEIAPGRAGDRRELAELAESAVLSALGTVRVSRRVRLPLMGDDLSRPRGDDSDVARSRNGDDRGAVPGGQRLVPAFLRQAGPQDGRGGP